MCGIFAAFGSEEKIEEITDDDYNAIQHRGPDRTRIIRTATSVLCFHRLAIMDLSLLGDQPMIDLLHNRFLMCNGEIYNYQELAQKHGFADKYTSGSDCEVLLHLYNLMPIEAMLKAINGVFAFVLWDKEKGLVTVARDPAGVRPLFYTANGSLISFASEAKALKRYYSHVQAFPAGTYAQFKFDAATGVCSEFALHPYWTPHGNVSDFESVPDDGALNDMETLVRDALTNSVNRQMHADRPIGCLLSGGLDSSLIAALVQRKNVRPIHTFSIGLSGSTDLAAARVVANHLKTIHHEVVVSEQDMLNALPDVVKTIESWDVTTIRASTGMYLLAKYIREKTDIRVIFSGEGSDEVTQGYLYFKKQPTLQAGDLESKRLIKDLMYYDNLRCDRTTARWGLEVRVPFLDVEFIKTYLTVPPFYRSPIGFDKNEKFLLRKAFSHDNLLPKEILWRTKEAFSDGVSTTQRSWHTIIQEHVELKITDDMMANISSQYPHCPPQTNEAYWFRQLFEKYYPGMDHLIPYQWLPKWCGDVKDPSARVLTVYHQ